MQPSTVAIDDELLIRGCLAGDQAAWELLLERYTKLVYLVALRFRLEESAVEEVFQEVCLVLLEKLVTLQDPAKFKYWLISVTRRVCLQRLRSQPELYDERMAEELALNEDPPEKLVLQLEQQELLYEAFTMLDTRCQQLLSALFMEQPTPAYEVLAKTFNISVGSIGPTRSRCLEKLRQVWLKLDQR